MTAVETDRFTVGVFQDIAWAERGIEALKRQGFPANALTVISKDEGAASALIERTLGAEGRRMDLATIGSIVGRGPLIDALQGSDAELTRRGIAGSMRRAGFQAHDGRIFEALIARGGVLVAVRSESLAADALATLHAYGGGNAAIGAWTGRV